MEMDRCDYCGVLLPYEGLQNRVELPDDDYVILCDICFVGKDFEVEEDNA